MNYLAGLEEPEAELHHVPIVSGSNDLLHLFDNSPLNEVNEAGEA